MLCVKGQGKKKKKKAKGKASALAAPASPALAGAPRGCWVPGAGRGTSLITQ